MQTLTRSFVSGQDEVWDTLSKFEKIMQNTIVPPKLQFKSIIHVNLCWCSLSMRGIFPHLTSSFKSSPFGQRSPITRSSSFSAD